MTDTSFILEKTYNPKFPFRLTIKKDEEILLCLWVQDRLPTEGRSIFCIRQGIEEPVEPLEIVEKVPVISMSQFGKKLTIVLDRAINNLLKNGIIIRTGRSKFLVTKKEGE